MDRETGEVRILDTSENTSYFIRISQDGKPILSVHKDGMVSGKDGRFVGWLTDGEIAGLYEVLGGRNEG